MLHRHRERLMQIGRKPKQDDVAAEVVAHVGDDDRPYRPFTEDGSPWNRFRQRSRGTISPDYGKFLRPDTGAILGVVGRLDRPGDEPDRAERAGNIEDRGPSETQHDHRADQQGDYGSERNSAYVKRNRTRALGCDRPAGGDTVRGRKVNRFAKAEQDAHQQQRAKRNLGRRRCEKCSERPYRHTGSEHSFTTEAIRQPSAEHLRPDIAPEEGGEDEAGRRGVVALVAGERDYRDRDVDAVDVADGGGKGEKDDDRVTAWPCAFAREFCLELKR